MTARGTTDDPVSRRGDRCAYAGCPRHGTMLRLTRNGFVVLYCVPHYQLACELFDAEVEA